VAAASAKSLEIILREPQRIDQLRINVLQARNGLRDLGLDVIESSAAAIGLVCGDADHIQHIHDSLKRVGIFVPYASIYSGTGGGFLRISIFANYDGSMIESLLQSLAALI
jgi:7-keto-8-aminopelargonate synthetase-like enzyme